MPYLPSPTIDPEKRLEAIACEWPRKYMDITIPISPRHTLEMSLAAHMTEKEWSVFNEYMAIVQRAVTDEEYWAKEIRLLFGNAA